MEEEEKPLPVLPSSNPKPTKGKLNFVDMVQATMNSGASADPLFFNEVLKNYKDQGDPIELTFDKATREKIREKQGDEALAEWEKMYDATLQTEKLLQDKSAYTPRLAPSLHNYASGYRNFRTTEAFEGDKARQYADGYPYPVKIKSDEQVADQAPSIIDYDPLKGFVEREIKGPEEVNSIVSMTGENKRLTLATNAVMAEINPEIKEKIRAGELEPDDLYTDPNGMFRYRTIKDGERVKENIRSVWGPETYYHSNYFSELLETINDFSMDSLDALHYSSNLPINMGVKGFRAMGMDNAFFDLWDKSQEDYSNWSQSRRSTRSFEDMEGAFGNFTNLSKAVTNTVAQIVLTRGMGLVGGMAGAGATRLVGKTISDEALRKTMTTFATGYGMAYGASAAKEEAKRNGLSDQEGHIMGVTAGMVMALTDKITGGQFTDKVFGPILSRTYAKKIVTEISDQAAKLGMSPAEIVKDKSLYSKFVGNVVNKTYNWLSGTAETRLKNTVQGFVGEAFQETSEDGLNMLTQEFRDWITGEDKYDNTWSSAVGQLSESFVLGGIGGAFGGAMFFDKKHWEMTQIDESKYDWITTAALKGDLTHAKNALDKMYQEGKLGSTLFSSMQGSASTPMSLEKDPTAISQNELLYKQYKAQIALVENLQKKYENQFGSLSALGDFMVQVTGGKDFIESDEFADIEKDTAHMMQREAIAMEIKNNHAKNRLALELAKTMGTGNDFNEIEEVHAFNGQIISVKRAGVPTPEAPAPAIKTVLEKALGIIESNGPEISDVAQNHEEMAVAFKALNEAEYKLSKSPLNPDFKAEFDLAKSEFEAAQKAYEDARKKAKLGDDTTSILDRIRTYRDLATDFEQGERTKYYGQRAVLDRAKKKFVKEFAEHENMSVYGFRQRMKDREYFDSTIAIEDATNADLAMQYEALIASMAGLTGVDLSAALDQVNALRTTSNKMFLSPAAKIALQAKIADLTSNNTLPPTGQNNTFAVAQGTQMNEADLTEALRKLLSVFSLVNEDGTISADVLKQREDFAKMMAGMIQAGEAVDYTEIFPMATSLPPGLSFDQLDEIFQKNYNQIGIALKALQDAGFDFEGFSIGDFNQMLDILNGPEYEDFKANRILRDNLGMYLGYGEPLPFLEMMQKDAVYIAKEKFGIDLSNFSGEDVSMLARAFNANGTNMDNAGNSILKKIRELSGEAYIDQGKDDQGKAKPALESEDFIELEAVERLRKELNGNLLEVILQHEMNDWGKENDSEKFKNLFIMMKMLDAMLEDMERLAKANLNKRAGRDYRIKQGYVNFASDRLIELNRVLNFLTPEEINELTNLNVRPAREATSDQQKQEVDDRLVRLIDFEEKASKALQEHLADPEKAPVLLDSLGFNMDGMFAYDSAGNVSRSVFRDLHEDVNDPYDPEASHSKKEQGFNYLVQLERGNVRTFFNRFNQVIDEAKAKGSFMPSFEQAMAARQLFGFLDSQKESLLKQAISDRFPDSQMGKSQMDNHAIFVRGIAGAGKSSFVTNLAFQLYADETKRKGLNDSAIYSAPNQMQLDNVGKSFTKITGAGLITEPKPIDELISSGFNFEALGSSRIVVIDEATLLGDALTAYVNGLMQHNLTASPENKVKLVLIGDEFQNGPETMSRRGKLVIYRNESLSVLERTVPLTSPYRSGKIESYGLQMNHRRMIAELNKMIKAFSYRNDGEVYVDPDGNRIALNDSNWRTEMERMFNRFNQPKAFNYFELTPGIIDFGVKSYNQMNEVYSDFVKSLQQALTNGTDKEVALIVQNNDAKSKVINEILAVASTLGISITADQIKTHAYTSSEIQGSSRKHVFVAIDIEKARKEAQTLEDFNMAMTALYVAESREVESLVIFQPGQHANIKNLKRDAVLSYPQIEFGQTDANGNITKAEQDLVAENLKLVALIQRLAKPEETPQTGEIMNTDPATVGKPENEAPAGTNPPPAGNRQTADSDTSQQHGENIYGSAMEEFMNNPDEIINKVDSKKNYTMDDWLKDMEDDMNGACNI